MAIGFEAAADLRFLERNPRVRLHFPPTYSSWLNQIEIWFAKIRDRPRGVFAAQRRNQPKRFALSGPNRANGKPRQGFASPAIAALDPARHSPEDAYDQGEALLGAARTRDRLLTLWSNSQARQSGSGGS